MCIISPSIMRRTLNFWKLCKHRGCLLEKMQYVCNPFQAMFHLLSILCNILQHFSSAISLFKVNNGNIRTMCEICSKLTKYCSRVSIVDLKQVNSGWVTVEFPKSNNFFRIYVTPGGRYIRLFWMSCLVASLLQVIFIYYLFLLEAYNNLRWARKCHSMIYFITLFGIQNDE